MSIPLIILGAGASYDYSSLKGAGNVSPLTNELVSDQFLYPDLVDKYPGVDELLSDIIHQVRTRKRNFEEVLTQMKVRAGSSQLMLSQFAALEFYLKDLFSRISTPADLTRPMHQMNNYKSLLNRINLHSEGKACVITFNYDSLFENSLRQAPQKMSDYISGNLKLIKLHGSHDWIYVQPKSLMSMERLGTKTSYDWYLANPGFIEDLQRESVSPHHEVEISALSDADSYAHFPALAVPLIGKDKYVCPQTHIKALEDLLPDVNRVLIIGWKAGDPLLLDTLKKHLPQAGCKVLVVSNTIDGAEEIVMTVQEKLFRYDGQISARGGGFSDFMSDEASHDFFTR